MIAEYDGLRYLFRWHSFKGINQILNSASEMSAEELAGRIPTGVLTDIDKPNYLKQYEMIRARAAENNKQG